MAAIPDNIVYMTVDRGRLHLAKDDSYIGNVNSYNNCFTRFFAKLFRKAISVELNGSSYCFNKKSYLHLLKRLDVQHVTYKNIHQFRNMNALRLHALGGVMRDHLSASKVTKLTRKLIQALRISSFGKAKKYVGQGADVNAYFWERGNYGLSYHSYKKNLPLKALTLTAEQFTPITRACLAKQIELVNLMRSVGGVLPAQGQIIHFQRSITDVQVERHLETGYAVVQSRYDRARVRPSIIVPTVREETTVHTHYLDKATQTHFNHVDLNYNFGRTVLAVPLEVENHAFVVTR